MRNVINAENAKGLAPLAQVRCGWITQITWSPDGTILGVAGADGVQLFVGQVRGQPTYHLTGHEGHVKGAAFSPTGQVLASIAADTAVKLWDTRDAQNAVPLLTTLSGHTDSVDAVGFHPTGSLLASGSADHTVILWDGQTYEQRARFAGHEAEVSSVTFALDGNVLFSGSWDHTIRMWDTNAETGGTVYGRHDDWVRDLTVNPSGTMLASSSKDGTVRLWDVYEAGQTYARIQAHTWGADVAAFSPDGQLLATGGRDNRVRVWQVERLLAAETARPDDALITLEGHEKPVMALAFNPAGTLLATGSGDNTVRLWRVSTSK